MSMDEKIIKKVESKIGRLPGGKIVFIKDFTNLGNDDAIRQSLKRLADKNKIFRLSKGIYYIPKKDKKIGILYPTAEQIAKAIAKRDKARIVPTGSFALYKLGLTSQIPMNVVFLTDGSPRKVTVGKQKILFKKTTPKNLSVNHPLSNLIIQSLRELGKENITNEVEKKLRKIISESGDADAIEENISYAPQWIRSEIKKLIADTNE